ncbi:MULTISPECIES: AarF/UbiB family protein [Pseudomonas]|uniref:AarF/UbiB family protein n=1 Tax=Pseudomonas TaxID=286 RepID=UPI002DB5E2C3|nr:AarF/UbiB family protein [Pseudomonas asiatica]MEB6592001.1 AarF/UbiB family protein [Pseudomonas asiatica]
MRHLSHLTRNFSKQNVHGVVFYVDPLKKGGLIKALGNFLNSPGKHQALDVPEATRGVYLLGGENKFVLKHNVLVHWKKRLQNYLGLKRTYGLHDLTNEFINLSVVGAKSDLVPKIVAFGYKGRFPFLKEEYLLVEYLENHSNVDERLLACPEDASTLMPKIFKLFACMLEQGFVHMDPHPKNILIAPDGSLKLIDFECCAHSVIDRDFSLGFLMGYFYHYWVRRYVSVSDYRVYCEAYLESGQSGLNRAVFNPVFERFISSKVSRTTRYSILTSEKAQAEFLANSSSCG